MTDPEFSNVLIDQENHILGGIRADGTVMVYVSGDELLQFAEAAPLTVESFILFVRLMHAAHQLELERPPAPEHLELAVKMRRASTAVYLATEASVADDLSAMLRAAADIISPDNTPEG